MARIGALLAFTRECDGGILEVDRVGGPDENVVDDNIPDSVRFTYTVEDTVYRNIVANTELKELYYGGVSYTSADLLGVLREARLSIMPRMDAKGGKAIAARWSSPLVVESDRFVEVVLPLVVQIGTKRKSCAP